MTETGETGPQPRACPICGKPAAPAIAPFCSARCADVDLHRWLAGAYVVPGTTGEAETEREVAEDEPDA